MFFEGFYEALIESGLDLLQQRVRDTNTLKSIFPDFKEQLAHRLQKLCINVIYLTRIRILCPNSFFLPVTQIF